MSVYTTAYTPLYTSATDPALGSGQYSVGKEGSITSLVYGGGASSIYISNTAVDPGSAAVQDQAVVGHDGQLFGVDTLPGMVVTQTGFARVAGLPAPTMDAYSALAAAWNDPSVRLAFGSVVILRAMYPGSSVVRRCYGRGRKIVPTYGQVNQGYLPFTSQFQAADSNWYSDAASSATLTMVPSFAGGLTPPLTPPYQLSSQTNNQQNALVNTGTQPTWPVVTFTGPISFPGIQLVNTPVAMTYNGSLRASDKLVIDTRPWARTALLNAVSVAGALTGVPMISLQLQPGTTVAKFTGQDYTGTATCNVRWRNAWVSIGGSL